MIFSNRARVSGLALSTLLLSSHAVADTGQMQFMITAFADLETLIGKSISMCEQGAPESLAPIHAAYADWKTTHLPYQREVRERLVRELSKPQSEGTLSVLRDTSNANLAENYFPPTLPSGVGGYCRLQLPRFLKGDDPMLKFRDYAEEAERLGTFKIFLKKR
jgi:hypothetical protein